MPYNDKPALFKTFTNTAHPPLLWASNRSFSCWLPIMNYGWPPLHVHSEDMSIPFLLFRTVFSAISCPILTRTSALLTLSVYLMRSIRRRHRFSHAFSLFSVAVVKLQISLPYSRIGITAALSSLSFIARLIHGRSLSGTREC